MASIINLDVVAGKKGDVITVRNGSDVLENGNFINVGALDNIALGRNVRKVEKLKEGGQLAYIGDPAMQYDERKDERDYTLVAGGIGRAYRHIPNESITIAKKMVDVAVVVGDELQVKADSYVLTKKTTGKSVAKVLEIYNFEGQDSYYIEFL